MSSTYTTSLKIQQIGNGEQSGTWGSSTNTNWTLAEQAITGVDYITMSNANYTLSNLNGTLDEARNAVIVVQGSINATYQIIAPLVNKVYIVSNQTTGTPANPSITFGGATGSVVTIPNGVTTVVYGDGTNFYSGITGLIGSQTISGNLAVTGNETVGGTLAVTGNTTLSGTLTVGGNQVLTSANYNSYTPTLSGTGATGTWGINITGTAASANTAYGFYDLGYSIATIGSTLTFSYLSNVEATLTSTGAFTATSFSGAGTGLTGTAASLTVGTATTATTANALNTSNSYGMVNLAVTGAEYNADGAVSLPSYSFTNAHSSGMYRDSSTGDVRIAAGGSECAAFTTAGNINVPGAVSVGGQLASNYAAASGSFPLAIGTSSYPVDRGIIIQNSAASSIPIYFTVSSGAYNPGYISCTTTTTTYGTTSDYRLKNNVTPMTGALDKVNSLNPVTYNWIADGSNGQGFIAHELQAVIPDAVTGEKDAVDANGKPKYQSIDTSFLVATLTAAIQELNAKVAALENQVLSLSAK